jgi:hypothetical protein
MLSGSVRARDAAGQSASVMTGSAEPNHAPLAGVIAGCAPATTAAENLSRAAASPTAVIDMWMHSPCHRSTLFDPPPTEISIGCIVDGGVDALVASLPRPHGVGSPLPDKTLYVNGRRKLTTRRHLGSNSY